MKEQFAACQRKVPYETAAEAEAAGKGKLSAYMCPVCSRYHLTSKRSSPVAQASEVEEKPTFDRGLLGRAWMKRDVPSPEARDILAVCLGRVTPDGRVRVKADGRELITKPVQPASLRLQLKAGVKVWVRVKGPQVEFRLMA